jgi:hypothetical protein
MKLEEEPAPKEAAADDLSLDTIHDLEIIEYDSQRQFEIGSVIYHRSWNDYGRVLEKIALPGDRQAIRVKFLNQGNVNLLENVREAE